MFGLTQALDTLWNLQRAMDDAMENDYFGYSTVSRSTPALNIFKEGDNTLVTLELPGVKKEDVHLEVKGKRLRLSGERKVEFPEKASLHRRERQSYKFDRSILLDQAVDEKNIKAELKDGVLAILLPPAEDQKAKSITIH